MCRPTLASCILTLLQIALSLGLLGVVAKLSSEEAEEVFPASFLTSLIVLASLSLAGALLLPLFQARHRYR
jgi:hypothetical protein